MSPASRCPSSRCAPSAGVRYQLNDAFSIYGNLGTERSRSDANSINANVGLRWQF